MHCLQRPGLTPALTLADRPETHFPRGFYLPVFYDHLITHNKNIRKNGFGLNYTIFSQGRQMQKKHGQAITLYVYHIPAGNGSLWNSVSFPAQCASGLPRAARPCLP